MSNIERLQQIAAESYEQRVQKCVDYLIEWAELSAKEGQIGDRVPVDEMGYYSAHKPDFLEDDAPEILARLSRAGFVSRYTPSYIFGLPFAAVMMPAVYTLYWGPMPPPLPSEEPVEP